MAHALPVPGLQLCGGAAGFFLKLGLIAVLLQPSVARRASCSSAATALLCKEERLHSYACRTMAGRLASEAWRGHWRVHLWGTAWQASGSKQWAGGEA